MRKNLEMDFGMSKRVVRALWRDWESVNRRNKTMAQLLCRLSAAYGKSDARATRKIRSTAKCFCRMSRVKKIL